MQIEERAFFLFPFNLVLGIS